jgi:methionine-rich copper-binding protein CopC
MNYQRIYNQLVSKRQQTLTEGYCEKHHIIPRCMGGTDEPENLVRLTAREHFVAHVLLAKIYPTNVKIIHAASFMMYVNETKYTNRIYQNIKISMSKAVSKRFKGKKLSAEQIEKGASKRRGQVRTPEQKENFSKINSGTNNPMSGKKWCNNGIINKCVTKEEFIALDNSWSAGRLLLRDTTGRITKSI